MTKEDVIKCFFEIRKKVCKDNIARYMKNHFPNEFQCLLEMTSFLDKFDSNDKNKKITVFERIYCLKHNLNDRPKCQKCHDEYVCGFNKTKEEYRKWCSASCQASDKTCIEKIALTKLKKYGCSNYNGIDKSRKTRIEKYGAWNDNDFGKKVKETKKSHYGNENFVNVEKIRKTKLLKYGNENYVNSEKNKLTRKGNFYDKLLKDENVIPLFNKEEYIKGDKNTLFKWKCLKCNCVFESKLNYNFKCLVDKNYHVRCFKCFPQKNFSVSNSETEVYDFIKSVYNGIVLRSCRSLISPLELDIVLPDMKLAFEFDGLYWHSTAVNSNKRYHLDKTEKCSDKGYNLIHIFEDEWNEHKDIVKSRILNLLGIYNKTTYARKCIVKTVNDTITKKFLNENHIQGNCQSHINIGLYEENDLIAMMTFGKPRFNKKYEWELLRFSNKMGYHIPGAASKLLNYFEKNYTPKSLVSYADKRWSNGKLYEKLNFTNIHSSVPNYWYVDNEFKRRYSRIKFQKYKLQKIFENFSTSMTEEDIMKSNGFYRIYDCGNLVFVKKYN